MSEEEKRFGEALEAVCKVAAASGVNAGSISGALLSLAALTSARAVGLDANGAHAMCDGAVTGMRDAAQHYANMRVHS